MTSHLSIRPRAAVPAVLALGLALCAGAAPPPSFPVVKWPGGAATPVGPGQFAVPAGGIIRWTVSFDNTANPTPLALTYDDLVDPTGLASCQSGTACPGEGQMDLMCPAPPDPNAPDPGTGTVATCDPTTGQLTITNVTVAASTLLCIHFSTQVLVTATGQVGNQGCYTLLPSGTTGRTQPTSSASPDPTCATAPPSAPPGCSNVLITSTAPPSFSAIKTGTFNDANVNGHPDVGEVITWDVAISNDTDNSQTGYIFDPVGTGQAFTAFSAGGDLGGTCGYVPANTDVECPGASFAAREVRHLSFTTTVGCAAVTPDDSIDFCNRARICGDAAGTNCFLSDDDGSAPFQATCIAFPFTNYTASTKTWSFTDVNNNGQVDAGDQVTFEIRVHDSGRLDGRNVVVSDQLDATCMQLPPMDAGGGTYDAGTQSISWTLASVPSGTTAPPIRFTVAVTGTTTCCNQAFIKGPESGSCPGLGTPTNDPVTPAPADRTCVPFGPQPRITVTKDYTVTNDVNNNGQADSGDTVHFLVTIQNVGAAVATNVSFNDPLFPCFNSFVPAGVVITGQGTNDSLPENRPTSGGQVIVDQIGGSDGLAPNGAETVTIAWDVVVGDPACCNQGTVTYAESGVGVQSDDPATGVPADRTCMQRNVVSMTLQEQVADQDGDSCFEPGELLTYTLTVTAFGADIPGVQVVDDINDPSGLLTVTDPGGGTYAAGPDTITWNVGTVAEGTPVVLTWHGTLGCSSTNGQSVTDQSTATGTGVPASSAGLGVTVQSAVLQAQVGTGWGDTNANGLLDPGEVVNYSITIMNQGTCAATNVTVTDQVDSDLQWSTLTFGPDTPADDGTGGIAWNPTNTPRLASIGPGGASVTLNLSGVALTSSGNTQPNPDCLVQNSVLAAEPAQFGCAADQSTGLAATLDIQCAPPAVLSILETVTDEGPVGDADGCFEPGETLTFHLDVTSTGGDAQNVVLTDTIADPNTDLATVLPGTATYDTLAHILTWTDLGTIAAGTTTRRTWTAVVSCPTPTCDTCPHDLDTWDDTANASSSSATAGSAGPLTSTISAPNITVTKTAVDASGDGNLYPGEVVTFTIVVSNQGSCAAHHGVAVQDLLDSDLDYTNVVASDGATNDGAGSLTWDGTTTPALADLASGGTVTLTVTAPALDPARNTQPGPDGSVYNKATSTFGGPPLSLCGPIAGGYGQLMAPLAVVAPPVVLRRNDTLTRLTPCQPAFKDFRSGQATPNPVCPATNLLAGTDTPIPGAGDYTQTGDALFVGNGNPGVVIYYEAVGYCGGLLKIAKRGSDVLLHVP